MVNQTIPANSGGLGKMDGFSFHQVQDFGFIGAGATLGQLPWFTLCCRNDLIYSLFLLSRWNSLHNLLLQRHFMSSGKTITHQGRILTLAGVTIVICCAPIVAFINLISLAVWPSWIAVAISETVRKMVTYVVTRSGRELLFTVVTQD